MAKNSWRVSDDWNVEIEPAKDPSGNWIVKELHITPKNQKASNLGITTSLLRQINVNDLLDEELDTQDWIEETLMFSHPDWEKYRQEWLDSVKGKWIAPGIKSHPEWMYARVAFFFVLAQSEDRMKPISRLAKMLEIDSKAASRRVDKARQLGLLTRPSRPNKSVPAGKSGGTLTEKCKEILNFAGSKNDRASK